MSTTYAYTVLQAINRAFRVMGLYDQYSSGTNATDQANALEALNLIIKSWSANNLQLWLVNPITVPMTVGVNSYALGPTGTPATDMPLRIATAFRHQTDSGTDVSLTPMSRQEYAALGLKTLQAPPTQYNYTPGTAGANGTLLLYPTPDSYTAANGTLVLYAQTMIPDILTTSSNLLFPPEWYLAIVLAVADQMAPEYPAIDAQKRAEISNRAAVEFDKVSTWAANEQTSTFFTLNQRGYR